MRPDLVVHTMVENAGSIRANHLDTMARALGVPPLSPVRTKH